MQVMHLVIARPHNFTYQSGDYVFIQIPTIAKFEWHPFTISSAPELKDEFWLHIRGVGSWTNKVCEYFESRLRSKSNTGTCSHNEANRMFHATYLKVPSSERRERTKGWRV